MSKKSDKKAASDDDNVQERQSVSTSLQHCAWSDLACSGKPGDRFCGVHDVSANCLCCRQADSFWPSSFHIVLPVFGCATNPWCWQQHHTVQMSSMTSQPSGDAFFLKPKVLQFEPKVLGYLRFLQESKLVFDCLEGIVAGSDDPSCAHHPPPKQSCVIMLNGMCLSQQA
jgi:hypothetical protein